MDIKTSERVLRFLNKLGVGKTVRECYKHSIQREVSWRVQKFFNKADTEVINLEGYDISVNRFKRGIEKDLWIQGIRESESTALLESEIDEGMLCVDIGANIGYYALKESVLAGEEGKVLAIEPLPESFERLQQNLEMNDTGEVETVNAAITGKDSTCEMLIREDRNVSRVMTDDERRKYREVETVESKKLEDIIEESPDVIRMDLEGFEAELIQQIVEMDVQELKIFAEVHPGKMKEVYGADPVDFWRKLSENNFRLKYLIQHGCRVRPSYFIRRDHPPRQVKNIDMTVAEALKENIVPLNSGRPFRAFLEVTESSRLDQYSVF